ncbi:MAG: hypothetical protein CMJ78_23360 [Planctomycetaceae bacterium]|nr:hypothetical protein [Planctomycetaceae bacterium]
MTSTQKQAPSKIIMLAPVALVLIVYGYAFNSPQQDALRRARTRLDTLSKSQHDTEHELAEIFEARANSRKAQRELNAELDQEQQRQDVSIQHVTAMREELLSPSLPVAAIQNVTRLLGDHRLRILASLPDNASFEKARGNVKTLVSLLVDDKSGQTAKNLSKDIHRVVYRLKLSGRFEDVRQALEALAEDHQNIVTLSLEMERLELEAASGRSQNRIWYLTIMV